MRSLTRFLLLSSVLVVAGCAGKSLDVGAKAEPPVPDPDAARSGNGSEVDGGGSEIDGSKNGAVPVKTLAEAAATCAEPKHGPVASYGTPAELSALLVHRWYSCDRTKLFGVQNTSGIQFLADGRWFRLLDNGRSEGLDLGTGIDNEGTWKVFDSTSSTFRAPIETTPGRYTYVYVYDSSGGFFPTTMAFESDRKRLKTVATGSGPTTWLVPLD